MYNAEKFLLGFPGFQAHFIRRLKETGAINPFNPIRLKEAGKGMSTTEKGVLDFALMLFNNYDYKCDVSMLMANLGNQESLDYLGQWVAKGYRAFD